MTLMQSAGSGPAGGYDPLTPEVLADPAAAHRLPGLRLADQPERTDSFMMWGPKTLRVAWDVPLTGGDS
jgi:hypothetical protein